MVNLALRTKDSPRFENDMLCFYVGDTFNLELDLNIYQDKRAIEIQDTDIVSFEFRDVQHERVAATKEFLASDIEDGKLIFEWDEEFTKKFHKGKYTYRVRYNSNYITTLVADNVILVM